MRSVDVLTIGETMVLVASADGPLHAGSALRLTAAGAESNVAATLGQAGFSVSWASRLGDDPLGSVVLNELSNYGIDTTLVAQDAARPTGVFFKNISPAGTSVHYYRRESAASAIGVQHLAPWTQLIRPRLVHVTGVTAALSESTHNVVQSIAIHRPFGQATVSFDVNYRPTLWSEDAGDRLLHIARHADIVFVGLDEAAALWNVDNPADVHRLLPQPRHVIVKNGADPAVGFTNGGQITVPALAPAAIVDVVGAGDAFAAGWLGAHLQRCDAVTRLRMGHWSASRVIATTADVAPLTRSDWNSAIATARSSQHNKSVVHTNKMDGDDQPHR